MHDTRQQGNIKSVLYFCNYIYIFLHYSKMHKIHIWLTDGWCFISKKQTRHPLTLHLTCTKKVSNKKPLLLTCPGSVEFLAVSRTFQLQTQNPLDGKCRPAFCCHRSRRGCHNDWSDWLINKQPREQKAPSVLTKLLTTKTKLFWFTVKKIVPWIDFLSVKILMILKDLHCGPVVSNQLRRWMNGKVWGTREAAGIRTADYWFKWEWRIYTGHQLELRSGFPFEWESLRFHTAANLCCVCVSLCVTEGQHIYIFSLLTFTIKCHNSTKSGSICKLCRRQKKHLCVSMYVCVYLYLSFPSCHILYDCMCEIRMRSLFKNCHQCHTNTKHNCALFFWITKVENQFSFHTKNTSTLLLQVHDGV